MGWQTFPAKTVTKHRYDSTLPIYPAMAEGMAYTLANDSMIIFPEPSVVMTNRYGSLLVVPSFCTKRTVAVTVLSPTERGFARSPTACGRRSS